MKKRVPAYILVVVLLLLSASLWKNHSDSLEKKHLRNSMLTSSLQSLIHISTDLQELLTSIEADSMPYEQCENKLISLSNRFTELHFSLKTFATYSPPYGSSRNCYSGIINFEFIARTLIGGTGEINGNKYAGIMTDNDISDKEIQYLQSLKEAVDIMIDALAAEEDPYQIHEDMSTPYIDNVIGEFFDYWYLYYDDSPLYLLFV